MRKVLVLGKIRDAGLDRLRAAQLFEVVERPDNPSDLHEQARDTWGIVVRTTPPINRALLQHAPELRIVARHGVGYDAVDVPALTERGIPLAVTGDVNAIPVAEHALALMLDLAKKITPYDHAIRDGRFNVRDAFAATELGGQHGAGHRLRRTAGALPGCAALSACMSLPPTPLSRRRRYSRRRRICQRLPWGAASGGLRLDPCAENAGRRAADRRGGACRDEAGRGADQRRAGRDGR